MVVRKLSMGFDTQIKPFPCPSYSIEPLEAIRSGRDMQNVKRNYESLTAASRD